jgi:16S rRNA (cytosine1402-N4)-methyltransferase
MLDPVLRALRPRAGARLVDATLGLGGHAEALLPLLGPKGLLIGIDRDPFMLERARARLARHGDGFRAVHARFSVLRDVVRGAGVEQVDGILFDLGVNSAQLDDPARGMSFRSGAADAPLDMRMDPTRGETAAELLERIDASELEGLLRGGGAPAPRRTAQVLLAARPLKRVGDLLRALEGVPALRRRQHHPATLVFQALRIAVNRELEELESALPDAIELLAPGGRLVVLSYHSGEDRRVKRLLQAEAKGCICPPGLPACACGRSPRVKLLARGEPASPEEIARNPRSRSARLRAAERL